jgi:Ni2+-binding GTPase involved in maturation of urease and hydrogenase
VILVGGFLGAGKTTLLQAAAERLMGRGLRVGLITNDQAPDLVDTHWLKQKQLGVQEVAGSCFCCNFPGLLKAANGLRAELDADVLIAEPVGSCTDLSATIVQPLKDLYRQDFAVSPLTVLCDPRRLRPVLAGESVMHPSAAYIYRKQLQEADLIVLAKTDTLAPGERDGLAARISAEFPGIEVRCLSARTGEGVEEWLNTVLESEDAGRRVVEVDYDTYAEGEAVLGWLNAEFRLGATDCCIPDWRHFCRNLMQFLQLEFSTRNAAIGHAKVLVSDGEGLLLASLTSLGDKPELRGEIDAAAVAVRMVINIRVEMPPAELEERVRTLVKDIAGECATVETVSLRSLQPGRPKPTYRYRETVSP